MHGCAWTASDLLADVALCVLYTLLNAALNSANRLSLGWHGFSFPVMLTATHMFFNLVFLAPPMVLLPSYRKEHRRLFCGNWMALVAIAVLNVTQIALNNSSLVHIELSMNQVVRATLPVFVALIQSVRDTPPTLGHMTALIIISMGANLVVYQPAVVSGSEWKGVLLVALSVAMQASQMCFAGSLLSAKLDAMQITFYTAPIAFLTSVGPAVALEGSAFMRFVASEPWRAFVILAGTSLLAAVYNVVVFQTIQRLSAVGSAVLGNVKVVVLLLLSSLLMREMLSWSAAQRVGCVLTFGGAAAYSALKLMHSEEKTRGSGSWRALWSSSSRSRVVVACLGVPVVLLLALLLVLSDWAVFRQAVFKQVGATWQDEAGLQARGGGGADPCRDLALAPEEGEPQPAPAGGELVLVTGGSGFIGSHLVAMLLDLGYSVRVLDSLETGNLLFLDLRHPRLDFHYGDMLDEEAVRRAMVGVRGVFHLGAASKVLPSLKDPGMATFNYERNAVGTSRVLQLANETGAVRKVVYAASSTYYGNQPVPFAETDPFMPTSPYAASKYMGELEMLTHDNLYHLDTLSLRFFMVYGPRNPSQGAYAIVTGKFLGRLQEGLPLLIEGSGENFRDFVHVRDIGRALILGYQSSVHGTVINIGTGKAYSVSDVADMVSENQVHVAPRRNDLLGTLADTCRAKRLLHFQARHDFLATMRRMIADAKAGRAEYLAEMWEDPRVAEVLEAQLPGWGGLASARARSDRVRQALAADSNFLQGLLGQLAAGRP